MSTPNGQICPPTTWQAFPTPLAFTIDSQKYSLLGLPTPLGMTFQWGIRMTPPTFESSANGVLGSEPSTTTMRYLDKTFTLIKVQLTDPTHKTWVTPYTAQQNQLEDVLLTFECAETLTDIPQFIVIVIPIIRSGVATSDPAYLQALADPNTLTAQTSVENLFPTRADDLYAYYTICARGFQANDPPQNIQIIVLTRGLYVSNTLMTTIRGVYNSTSESFGIYEPPLKLVFNTRPATGNAFDETLFRSRVQYAFNLIKPQDTQPAPTAVIDEQAANAYKCVPFDPEKQLSADGKIRFDPDTGVPLLTVEAERTAVIEEITKADAKRLISPDVFAAHVSDAISVILAFAAVGVVFYLIFSSTGATDVPEGGAGYFAKLFMSLKTVPTILIIGVLAGFTGFMVGLLMKRS